MNRSLVSKATAQLVIVLAVLVLGQLASRGQEAVDCGAFPFNARIHANPIVKSPHQTAALLLESDEIALARGGHTTFYVSLVTQLATDGVQGYSLGINVTGNVLVDEARLDGTSSAQEPDGLSQPGNLAVIRVAEPIESDTGEEPEGRSVTLGVVYSFTSPVTMIPTGTANVAAVDISAPDDEEPRGEIEFRNGTYGLFSIENVLTVNGESEWLGPEGDRLMCARGAPIVAVDDPTFIRGDADGNGKIELTDGLHVHRFLFLGDPEELACEDAADLNDSGRLDITDGIIVFQYLFLGGRPPEPPFPACGVDRSEEDLLSCDRFDPCT